MSMAGVLDSTATYQPGPGIRVAQHDQFCKPGSSIRSVACEDESTAAVSVAS